MAGARVPALAAKTHLRCLIMGPPGSGKGTVASRIISDFGFVHVSTGDVLRYHMRQETDLGKEAKKFISKGQLVPNDLICDVMLEELKHRSIQNCLIDGFPRTTDQCHFIQVHAPLDCAIELDVPFKTILDRVKERWIHEASGRIYNLSFNPPEVPGKDNETGEPLTQREDDKPETVEARLRSYADNEKPVAAYLRSLGLLTSFSGTQTNEIWPKVFDYLEEFRKPLKRTCYE